MLCVWGCTRECICPRGPEEGIKSQGAVANGGCELPDSMLEPSSGPLEAQQVLVTLRHHNHFKRGYRISTFWKHSVRIPPHVITYLTETRSERRADDLKDYGLLPEVGRAGRTWAWSPGTLEMAPRWHHEKRPDWRWGWDGRSLGSHVHSRA